MIDIFGKKKKLQKIEEEEIKISGINIQNNPISEKKNMKINNIILNGSINAMITIATLLCMLDSFGIKYHVVSIIGIISLFSLFVASFYEYKLVRIFGYLSIVIIFIYSIISYRNIIRGGFGTITNAFMEVIELKLDLPIERRYTEYGGSKIFAVSLCVIFIGCSLTLIFNIVISEAKGFALIFLITFPIVQLGMYFDKKINLVYFTVYMSAMVALMILRTSGHYKSETSKRKGYKKYRKKKIVQYDYVNDGRNGFSVMKGIVIISVFFVIVISILYPRKRFYMPTSYGEWKRNTESFSKKMALVGFWGMLNPSGSGTGGIGRNRLGDAKYVKLDYQTDLGVTVDVTDDEKTIYLRSYTGTYYRDNSWKYISEEKSEKYKPLSEYGLNADDVLSLNYNILDNDYSYLITNYRKYIEVYNVAANQDYMYMNANASDIGYFCDEQQYDDQWNGTLLQGYGLKYWYYHIREDKSLEQIKELAAELRNSVYYQKADVYNTEEKYRKYVYNTYLDVPDKNAETIEKIINEYNLDNNDLDSVDNVIQYLNDNYTYTLMPGRTPEKEDFVNYFLTKSKKGYCSYFASSAVLMFRQMGIPSRYVGGYAVSTTDLDYMYEKQKTENIYKTFVGDGMLSAKAYDIEVNDSCAHAWVEVYIDNLGWIPVEVTPPSTEDEITEETNPGFMQNIAAALFSQQTAKTVKNTTFKLIVLTSVLIVFGIIIFTFAGIIIRKYRKKNVDIESNLKYLIKILRFAELDIDEKTSFEKMRDTLIEYDICEAVKAEEFMRLVEKKKYSRDDLDEAESKKVHEMVLSAGTNVYDNLSGYMKFKFKFFKCLIKN